MAKVKLVKVQGRRVRGRIHVGIMVKLAGHPKHRRTDAEAKAKSN